MAGNHGRPSHRQLTFNDMQVRATNAAGSDTQQNLVGGWFRVRRVRELKRPIIHGLGGIQDAGFHVYFRLRTFSPSPFGERVGVRVYEVNARRAYSYTLALGK